MGRPKKSDRKRTNRKAPKADPIPSNIRKVDKEYMSGGKRTRFAYKDVVYQFDDWVDASRYLPADYDLMYMRLADERVIPGWCCGTKWEGMRLKPEDQVIAWKRKNPEPEIPKIWSR